MVVVVVVGVVSIAARQQHTQFSFERNGYGVGGVGGGGAEGRAGKRWRGWWWWLGESMQRTAARLQTFSVGEGGGAWASQAR